MRNVSGWKGDAVASTLTVISTYYNSSILCTVHKVTRAPCTYTVYVYSVLMNASSSRTLRKLLDARFKVTISCQFT